MPRWSATAAAQTIKLIVVPVFGLLMLYGEQQRDVPRTLLVVTGLILIGVAPASVAEWLLLGRSPSQPAAEPPDQDRIGSGQ